MGKTSTSEVSDLNQEIMEAMELTVENNEKKKERSMYIPKSFHQWNDDEFTEAKRSGAINSKCKLKYTLEELESFIIETVNRGDTFAGEKHFRLFIFLRLAMKLPPTVYSSIFWFFHDQHFGITPYAHTNGIVVMPYFEARIRTDRIDLCPLKQTVIDQIGDVRLELRYANLV